VTIRAATSYDVAAVAALHVAAWRAAYRGIIPDDHLAALEVRDFEASHRARLEDPRMEFLVADDRGVVRGFAILGRSRDADVAGDGELHAIYVDPAAWGQGHGAALMRESMTRLRSLGFARSRLWVLRDNVRARRFYEKHRWEPDGTEKPRTIGVSLVEVRYRTIGQETGFSNAPTAGASA
jgi:ribosomal protein S18 acetylase RimI-like enzyme